MKKEDSKKLSFYYVIMKILNIINLIGILLNPITLDRYKTIQNNTGKLLYDGSQVSYVYSFEDVGANGSITPIVGGIEVFVPSVYKLDIIIELLNPVAYANVTLNFTAPTTTNYYLNYIVENARIVSSSRSQLQLQLVDTHTAHLQLWFTIDQLKDDYAFSANTALDYAENWVNSGQNYFDITSVTLTSVTDYEGEYIPKLNNILNSVDGIEGLLNTLISNTSTISNIYTNITSILNVLNDINNTVDELIKNDIEWVEFFPSVTYVGYTNDFMNVDDTGGYHDAGYYVLSNINFNSDYLGCIYKIQLPLGGVDSNIEDYKFYQYRNNELHELTLDNVLFFADRYKSTWYIVFNEEASTYPLSTDPILIYCSKRIYYYRNIGFKAHYLPNDTMQYWTIYGLMKENKNFSDIKNGMDDIISILSEIDIEQGALDEKTIVDNFFQQIKQTLIFPSAPGQHELMPVLKSIVGIYRKLIDIQSLSMYKWILGITAYTILFKVITR